MVESLQSEIDAYLRQLNGLIERGGQLRDLLAADPSNRPALGANRVWQQECGAVINQLSGGSKGHWLARSYSQAFLVRSTGGGAVESVPPAEIINRLLGVLEQAAASLSGMAPGQITSMGSEPAATVRRFDFVHSPELRPVLEQAYADSRRALEQGRYGEALLNSCGVLEAIVTDALQHQGPSVLAAAHPPAGEVADWPFGERLAVAERAGLIHGGCARLPLAARRYRDGNDAEAERDLNAVVSERDARLTGQVLHVIMRDLDPGR